MRARAWRESDTHSHPHLKPLSFKFKPWGRIPLEALRGGEEAPGSAGGRQFLSFC